MVLVQITSFHQNVDRCKLKNKESAFKKELFKLKIYILFFRKEKNFASAD